MIDALQALPIGEAYREIELRQYKLPKATYGDLSAALSATQHETNKILQDVFNAIAIVCNECGPESKDVPTLGTRFEVNTHNIMSMRSRNQMDVQIIVSVLRVK
jgi:hypothetical protein